ncbi:reverse transcriptase domain-containing protein [Tanacetum coccineum]|uniref:Reverse transcriptase domain-containing protein n=1 Tax=Tanacetum coccineum TaxID=301880 RepID=A0ABQ5G295_9ASTR
MPKGAKVLKDLLSHKEKLEKAASSVKLSEECSAVIQRSLPQKEGDPGSFTLPWISKLKPTKMSIQHVDRSIKYPIRVRKNLLVKVSKFIFPIDFVVLEIDEDELVPIILGRPFLATSIADIKGIDSSFCTHKILMEDEFKPNVQPQRRVNPNIKEVVPKKGGMTIVKNENDELIPQWIVTGWRVCIDYHKLNNATQKYHFPLPFHDQMLERLAGHEYYCFLDGLSGYFQIPIAPEDQEKTTFTCPYVTFTYKRIPFGLCNAPATFQRCMTTIFHELIEDNIEVFMDDFSVFGAENLAADHLSRLENPDLEKLTRAEIRDLFPEEQLMAISDKNNEPCMLTESYEDAWPKMRQHKFFDNVTVDHPEDIMASPPPQEKSSRPSFTGNISFAMHINELDEMRLDAYESSISYKERTKRWHDKRIQMLINYEKGDEVLLFNSRFRLFPWKLMSRWYRPFLVSKDIKNRAIELYDEEGSEFIVNKQRVKPYQRTYWTLTETMM